MLSDNCTSAFEDEGKLDIPQRKRSHSRYSSRHKNNRSDKLSRHQDGYSTASMAGLRNESEFEDDMVNNCTHGLYMQYRPPTRPLINME